MAPYFQWALVKGSALYGAIWDADQDLADSHLYSLLTEYDLWRVNLFRKGAYKGVSHYMKNNAGAVGAIK